MKYRKLRIAWSVGWGLLCLLLIGLWVRSHSQLDSIGHISSWEGSSYVGRSVIAYPGIRSGNIDDPWIPVNVQFSGGGVPYLLVVVMVLLLAYIPWVRHTIWRFSLRTLLITTTLVALALGLIIATTR